MNIPPAGDALRIAGVRVTERTTWTFVWLTQGPHTGVGEATLEGRHVEIRAALERFGRELLAAHHPLSDRAIGWIEQRLLGAGSLIEATALSALEQATQDLLAREAGLALQQRLGGARRQVIPLYANINRGTVPRSPEQFAVRALKAASQGFAAIKLAPFDGVTPQIASTPPGLTLIDAGLARVAAVSEALADAAPNTAVMVDCHWRFDETSARAMVHELERLNVRWYECPVPESEENHAAIRSLRGLANSAGMQLAGAETMTGLAGFAPFLKGGLYDVVMPDVKHAGGLAMLLRIAEACAQHGVGCSPHNPTGPICHAHSLHVAALIDDMPSLEVQFEETDQFFALADSGLPDFHQGASALPVGPGLGVQCLA